MLLCICYTLQDVMMNDTYETCKQWNISELILIEMFLHLSASEVTVSYNIKRVTNY